MLNLINNPWVVGIFGGIFSGIIVTFISRSVLSRRDRKEYLQKVLSANKEVIYALRPGISEGSIPESSVIEALISATARKFGVDKKDLYTSSEIGQELIKEVMDSSFIAMSTKTEYCNKLAEVIHPPKDKMKFIQEVTISKTISLEEYRAKWVAMVSTMLGIIAAFTSFYISFSKEEKFGLISEIPKFTIIVMIFTIISIFFTIIFRVWLKNITILKKNKDDDE